MGAGVGVVGCVGAGVAGSASWAGGVSTASSEGEGSGGDVVGAVSFGAQPLRNSPMMSNVAIPIDKTLLFDHI